MLLHIKASVMGGCTVLLLIPIITKNQGASFLFLGRVAAILVFLLCVIKVVWLVDRLRKTLHTDALLSSPPPAQRWSRAWLAGIMAAQWLVLAALLRACLIEGTTHWSRLLLNSALILATLHLPVILLRDKLSGACARGHDSQVAPSTATSHTTAEGGGT